MAMDTCPSAAAIMSVPVDAPMSTALWLVDAPSVGASLEPKYEVIRLLAGHGHVKVISPILTVLYVCPCASAFRLASSSWRLSSAYICAICDSWAAISAWYWLACASALAIWLS